jgi:uncharacterized protein
MLSLHHLINYGNPALISRNLRTVIFDYLEDELTIGTTNSFLELLPQLNYLFNFLEEAAEAQNKPLQELTKKQVVLEEENCAPLLFTDELLYRATLFLVTTLQPERIYCILHKAETQQQSFTDLLIVLPGTAQQKPFSEYETIMEAGSTLGTQLTCTLQHASHINEALKEGHIVYSLVCTKENLLYWNEEKEWPTTPQEKLEEIRQQALQRFHTNFSKAETFLQHATQSSLQTEQPLTTFFLQQAAELCCRALLIALTGRDKKTHAISNLKKTCRRCTAVVEQVFPANTEEEKRLLQILDDAYIAARYEDDFSPSATDIEKLFQKVQQLHQSAVTTINIRLRLPA